MLANDSTISDSEIRDQVDTLIGAGYDTTASTLAWLLWRAATQPGVWQQLRAEADSVLGPPDGPGAEPDERSFAGLDYARRVVRESLRLHPAGLVGARVAASDLVLGRHRIGKGTLIVWSPYLAGRDDSVWADSLRFEPDRHRDVTPAQKAATDHAWVPFGRGPHMCIGFALARMELALIVARLAQRLDLSPNSSTLPRPVGMVVNRPEGGAPFGVSPRSASS